MPASWNFIKPPPWEQLQWSETHIQLTWAHQFSVEEASTFCKSFSPLQKLYCIFNVHVTFSFWRRNGYEPKTSCGSFWRWLLWGSLQLQTGEWRWSQFSARLEERTDGGTQHRLGKLSESRECLLPGYTHFMEKLQGDLIFMSPIFLLTIHMINMTLYLKYRQV